GKLVLHDTAQVWVRLTEPWGEERVTKLVEGMERLEPAFGTANQVLDRIVSGEYPLVAAALQSQVFQAQADGAPGRFADEVKPIISDPYALVVPQKAKSPNAARLLMAFSLTPEGQQIWWEEAKYGSHLVPGTPIGDFSRGKEVFVTSQAFLDANADRLDTKYLKILGLK
ncbi:MAG: substrate-binding domain-containing protein, partial [Dehalococcoidia bacterium]|nr:substrate-binding domain-containing protein [Dehalococcoidia bacterium]